MVKKFLNGVLFLAGLTIGWNTYGSPNLSSSNDRCPITSSEAVSDHWQKLPYLDPPQGDKYQFQEASITQLGMTGYYITCRLMGTDSQPGYLMKNSASPIKPATEKWSRLPSGEWLCKSSSPADCAFFMPS